MKQLIIKLTGEIQSSNFIEWKTDIIAQVKSIKTELTTDDDFAIATNHVKSFKEAEKSLKAAKQSAINQAPDIQELFAAIDEVSEEVRQTRLTLERQIKARKAEIKEEFVDSGLEIVRSFIKQQSPDFNKIDHSEYLDRNSFYEAIKAKAGVKGLQIAIDSLCSTIKAEILQRAQEVANNATAIDSLPDQYKLLFQDRDSLLSINKEELAATIEKRSKIFNAENEYEPPGKEVSFLEKEDAADSDIKEKYRITIDIFTTKSNVEKIARDINDSYENNDSILSISLGKF